MVESIIGGKMKIEIYTKENKHIITVYTKSEIDNDVMDYIIEKEYPSLKGFRRVNYRHSKLSKNGNSFYSNQVDILEKYAK